MHTSDCLTLAQACLLVKVHAFAAGSQPLLAQQWATWLEALAASPAATAAGCHVGTQAEAARALQTVLIQRCASDGVDWLWGAVHGLARLPMATLAEFTPVARLRLKELDPCGDLQWRITSAGFLRNPASPAQPATIAEAVRFYEKNKRLLPALQSVFDVRRAVWLEEFVPALVREESAGAAALIEFLASKSATMLPAAAMAEYRQRRLLASHASSRAPAQGTAASDRPAASACSVWAGRREQWSLARERFARVPQRVVTWLATDTADGKGVVADLAKLFRVSSQWCSSATEQAVLVKQCLIPALGAVAVAASSAVLAAAAADAYAHRVSRGLAVFAALAEALPGPMHVLVGLGILGLSGSPDRARADWPMLLAWLRRARQAGLPAWRFHVTLEQLQAPWAAQVAHAALALEFAS